MFRRQVLKSLLAGLTVLGLPRPVRAQEELFDCVVIGGGVAGLTAAHALRDRNIVLLESQRRIGGRVTSGLREGWTYAKGATSLSKPTGALAEMIRSLNLRLHEIPAPLDWGEEKRRERLVLEGGLETYNRFLQKIKDIGGDYLPAPAFDPRSPIARLDGITAQAWFEEMNLPRVYHEIMGVKVRALFGASLDEVSALGLFETLAADFAGLAELDDLDNLAPLAPRGQAYGFREGLTEFTDGVRDGLGNKVRLGVKVLSITGKDLEGYKITYATSSGSVHAMEAESVVIATPVPITLQIGKQVLSPEQRDLLAQVPYAVAITASVFSNLPIFDKAFSLAPPGDFFFSGLFDSTWVQRHTDPEASGYGGHVASFHLTPKSSQDKSLLGLSDETIMDACKKDLDRLLPGTAERITETDVQRFRHGYPINGVGAFERLARLHETLDGMGLQVAGDGLASPTLQSAVNTGALAAQRIKEFFG